MKDIKTMHISFSTGGLLGYPLPYSLRLARAAGFDSVELMATYEVRRWGVATIRRSAARHNIRITSVHPSIIPSLTLQRESYRDNHLRSVELALALPDCEIVVWHVPSLLRAPEPEAAALRVLEEAVDMVKGTRIKIALENKAFKSSAPIDTQQARLHLARILELADRMDRYAGQPVMRTTLDTTHTATMALDLLECYDMWQGRVGNIHLSDAVLGVRSTNNIVNQELTQHRLVGTGVLPLMELIDRLNADAWQGLLTFELHPLALHWWNPFAVLPMMRQQFNLVNARAHAARPMAALSV